MTEPNPERPFGFALPDSETSAHPMAGTIIDQILALKEMGEHELADNLATSERMRLADEFAAEEEALRRFRDENSKSE